jgi:peptidoglycan/LPS O-acetylase OafA/YrhL
MQRHVMLLVQGVGGPVNWLLSWSCWVPLARLSYSCYLVHMTVVDWVLTLPSYSVTITHTLVLYHILANTAVSLAVAFVLVVLFEAPMLHMEKLLFGFMGLGKLPQVKKKAKVA